MLAEVRATTDPIERADGLIAILDGLDPPESEAVLSEALEAARLVSSETAWNHPMERLVPHLAAAGRTSDALKAADAIDHQGRWASTLESVVRILAAKGRMDDAIRVAGALGAAERRATLMRRDPYRGAATRRDRASLEEERWWLRLRDPALADYHKPSRGASATYGDQLVRPVASLIPRTGSALAAIAPLLGASDGGAALRTAYVAQQVALEPWLTRRSVATIAASLAGSLGAVDAVAVASKIDDTVVRSEALEAMARRMAALGRSAEAIAVARAVRDEWGRCELLAAVARELTVAGRPDDAMEAALAIEDELERLDTLSSIASSLRPRDIDRALRALAEVASGWRRDGALAALAARAAELDDGETALSAVRQLADDWVRAGALESVADRLDATTIVSAIELARSLSDRTGHDLALAATASRAASLGQGDEALASARAITDAGCRAEALTAIAPSLGATADQSQALSEAIEAAMSLADPARAAVLAAIAACAAQIGHSDENQAAVRWIGEEWWRERARRVPFAEAMAGDLWTISPRRALGGPWRRGCCPAGEAVGDAAPVP